MGGVSEVLVMKKAATSRPVYLKMSEFLTRLERVLQFAPSLSWPLPQKDTRNHQPRQEISQPHRRHLLLA